MSLNFKALNLRMSTNHTDDNQEAPVKIISHDLPIKKRRDPYIITDDYKLSLEHFYIPQHYQVN